LIGVVAGVVITTGANWLQGSRRDRSDRQRELAAATGQVIASTTSVIVLVQRDPTNNPMVQSLSASYGAQSEWAEKITRAVERLQIADQVIQRCGQKDLAKASSHVVYEATEFARRRGGEIQSVDAAIMSFTEMLHARHPE